MSDKASRMAAAMAAATTSRRGFLGRLAKTAGTAAAAMAGVLATGSAGAGRGGAKTCCVYWCSNWGGSGGEYLIAKCTGNRHCQERYKGCELLYSEPVSDCSQC